MIKTPELVTLSPQVIAKIHQVIPASQIRQGMGEALSELKETIDAQDITVTGPWFTHHLEKPSANFNFEACFPTSAMVKPTGRVQPEQLAEMKVVRTLYCGGYEGLGNAWGEFMSWITKNGYNVTRDFREYYLSGPESGTHSAEWQTELVLQLSD